MSTYKSHNHYVDHTIIIPERDREQGLHVSTLVPKEKVLGKSLHLRQIASRERCEMLKLSSWACSGPIKSATLFVTAGSLSLCGVSSEGGLIVSILQCGGLHADLTRTQMTRNNWRTVSGCRYLTLWPHALKCECRLQSPCACVEKHAVLAKTRAVVVAEKWVGDALLPAKVFCSEGVSFFLVLKRLSNS